MSVYYLCKHLYDFNLTTGLWHCRCGKTRTGMFMGGMIPRKWDNVVAIDELKQRREAAGEAKCGTQLSSDA